MEHSPFETRHDEHEVDAGPYLRRSAVAPSPVVRVPSRHDGDYLVALAAGLAGSMPIPWLDTISASAIRGGAMRRVAARHGLGISTEARRILGYADLARYRRFRFDHPFASLAERLVARVGIMSLVREVVAVTGSIRLFDTYLETRVRESVEEVDADEARRVRAAIERALERSLDESLSLAPTTLGKTIASAFDALRHVDDGGRSKLESVLDPIVDAIADAPTIADETLRVAFEDELAHLRPR